ncbi:MAG: class I SAM-dependent methyltransferase [Rhodobacteraceae bacterium]|nr:class I SAM-dependent methyltransferase [Paracoccaceae bacterium]
MTPDQILPTYDRVAAAWDKARDRTLFERRYLDRFLSHVPGPGSGPRRILDLGCGSGRPIASYLADRRAAVTGVDGSAEMIRLFKANVPAARAVHADMRGLDLGQRFDGILAWNSFFHLSPDDQRAMFAVFAAHAAPRAALMFTAHPRAGEPVGAVEGEPVYHASLDPPEYRALLQAEGFELRDYVPEAQDCRGHTIYLARLR